MAIGSGLGSQFGAAPESVFGTYVAPTRFYAGESFAVKHMQTVQEVTGVAAGRLAPPDEVVTTLWGTGSLNAQVLNSGFGLILAHLFGVAGTPVQQAATIAWLQTGVIADNYGKSLSLQAGVADTGGTVRPYTALGTKITKAEFSCAVSETLKMSAEFDARQVTEAQTIAAASYPAGALPFHGGQMDLRLGTYNAEATVSGVRSVNVSIERGQDTERFYAGNAGRKNEPIGNEFLNVSGSVEVDFATKADFIDRYVGHTSTSLVWDFTGPLIASTYYQQFRITLPKVYFGGDVPEVTGADINKATVPFQARLDLTNGLAAYKYMSTDTTL